MLLVDEDSRYLAAARAALDAAGLAPVHVLPDRREAVRFLASTDVDVLLLAVDPGQDPGMRLIREIREEHPQLPVIVMTGTMDVETAVACMKAGAFDYLVKPMEKNRFLSGVRRALEVQALRREVATLKEDRSAASLEEEIEFHGILTRNRKMAAALRYVKAAARSRQPLLITGETGVGKELVARGVHEISGCEGHLVSVNVAGLDDAMFSDTLFGHRKGAYTGAAENREGLIACASGGTLFLDEIGDLTEPSQVKLLRLLEQREYFPLGSDIPVRTDARILCATHRDLRDFVAAGTFRKDLFYRLNAHHIHIPPLRERREDIPLLVGSLLEAAAQATNRRKPAVPPELEILLSNYHFPGNVRELRTMIFDAVMQHRSGVLSLESFKRIIEDRGSIPSSDSSAPPVPEGNVPPLLIIPDRFPTLKEAEEFLIAEALKRAKSNQGIAALLLGISRFTLNKRLARGAREEEKAS